MKEIYILGKIIILGTLLNTNCYSQVLKSSDAPDFLNKIKESNKNKPRIDTIEDFLEGNVFNCSECMYDGKLVRNEDNQILYGKFEFQNLQKQVQLKNYEYFRINENKFRCITYLLKDEIPLKLNDSSDENPTDNRFLGSNNKLLTVGNYIVSNIILPKIGTHYYLRTFVAHKKLIKTDLWAEIIDNKYNSAWIGYYKNGVKTGIWKHKAYFNFTDQTIKEDYISNSNDIEYIDFDSKDTLPKISENNLINKTTLDSLQKLISSSFSISADLKTKPKIYLDKNFKTEFENNWCEFKTENKLTIYNLIQNEKEESEPQYELEEMNWKIIKKNILEIYNTTSRFRFEIIYIDSKGLLILNKL